MRRRREDSPEPKKPVEGPQLTLPVNGANESTIAAAAFLHEASRNYLLLRLVPDHFQQQEHRDLWTILLDAKRRHLEVDLALVEQNGGPQLREYVAELSELKPEEPKNPGHHVALLLLDHARISAVRGPIPIFFQALRDPKTEVSTLAAAAKAIHQAFVGHDDRKFLRHEDVLIAETMRQVEARVEGQSTFAYGIKTFDHYQEVNFGATNDLLPPDPLEPKPRMIPGAAPGQITVLTGVSGGGKSTVASSIAVGIAFPGWETGDFSTAGRRVLYGAWEMGDTVTYEGLACASLGWSRSDLKTGRGKIATREGREEFRARLETLKARIRIMGNPFRRSVGEKNTNEKNLDLLQGYISDSGCEVFVGDLWKRCLRHTEPDDEEEALIRQQAMAEEMRVHCILLQQQRLKDIEQRPDKRPTRDGIKGSAAWVEVADTIIGVHRPALFKSVPDDTLELIVLKQRYGKFPLVVSFRWDPETGRVSNGRHVEYVHPGEQNEIDAVGGGLAGHLRGR